MAIAVLAALVVVQAAEKFCWLPLWQSMVPSSVPWKLMIVGAGPAGAVGAFGAGACGVAAPPPVSPPAPGEPASVPVINDDAGSTPAGTAEPSAATLVGTAPLADAWEKAGASPRPWNTKKP